MAADLLPFSLSDLYLITKEILQAHHIFARIQIPNNEVTCVYLSRIRNGVFIQLTKQERSGETSGQYFKVNTFHLQTSFLSMSYAGKDLAVIFTFMSLKTAVTY